MKIFDKIYPRIYRLNKTVSVLLIKKRWVYENGRRRSMGLAPISGGISSGSLSRIEPMKYAVQNKSDFSDVYNVEATKQTAGVNAASPVQYANARETSVAPTNNYSKVLETSEQYNALASKFNPSSIGYTNAGANYAYDLAGSNFDTFM